jgi:hypothetical protein
MSMKRTVVALATAAAVAVGLALPSIASAQTPYGQVVTPYGQVVPTTTTQPVGQTPVTNPCPGGPQPIITSYIDSGSIFLPSFLSTGFLTPGVFTGGFGFPFGTSAVVVQLDRITEIRNFNGVEGLVLTVFSSGFSRPVLGLGVPSYILEAYGGNLNAIQQDLLAGYLRCRSS